MARGINKVILIGHLGKDPETRSFPSGGSITNVSIATSDSWKDKDGNQQERTEWHNVVFHNQLAEVVSQYLRKGSKVYIEGALRTRKWQDKDGRDRYTTEIHAHVMQMLDGKPASDSGARDTRSNGTSAKSSSASSYAQASGGHSSAHASRHETHTPSDDFDTDDIPF